MSAITPALPNDGDAGWGDTLNAAINQIVSQVNSHDSQIQQIGAGSVPPAATTSSQGVVQLAGDLAGTASAPTLKSVVTAGTAGSSTSLVTLTWDAKGRITAVTSTSLDSAIASIINTNGTASRSAISAMGGGVTSTILTNSSAPTISGNTAIGSVITASNGSWSSTPDSYAYTWQRNGSPISGATRQTYTTQSADAGCQISVLVTAYKSGYTSATAGSSSISVAAPVVVTTPTPPAAPVTNTYTATSLDFPNPERGFWQYSETHYNSDQSGYVPLNASTLATNRTSLNQSVVFRYFVMERYLTTTAIDQAWLDLVKADLDACRTAGVKIVPRFCYSTSGRQTAPVGDAPSASIVMAHQASIAPVLNNAKDVIAAVQCGLIGMWGEWYYTDNYGTNGTVTDAQWTDRLNILNKWLSSLDSSIPVLVRYAGIKLKRFGQNSTDPLTKRVGFHNDGWLAPYGDFGTFSTFTTLDQTTVQNYMANETLTVPMNGESAQYNGTDSAGPAAKASAAQYHFDALNSAFNRDVIGSWTDAEKAEISIRLGYRIALTTAAWPTIAPGASDTVSITLTNRGYAAPRHDKKIYVSVGTTRYAVTGSILGLQPGASATYTATITAPALEGNYPLNVELVDPNLPDRGEYSIRLANPEVSYTATRNLIGQLAVSSSAGTGGTTPTTNPLTLESGSHFLLEDGSSLLLAG